MSQYGKVEYLDPKKIEKHKDVQNIRSKINKADCKELMTSIEERGVQNPITVFALNGKHYLVIGERRLSSVRWLAEDDPKDLNFKTIPALVKDYGKDLKVIIREALYDNFVENVNREDLNGFDIANRLNVFISNGMNKQDLCTKIGKSITWVNECLKFLESDKEVQTQVKAGNISLDEAKKIAKLPQDTQAKVAKGLAVAKEIADSTGDKKAKKAIKKGIDKATRTRSSVAPTKKEVKRSKNMVFEILEAMKKSGDKDSKPFLVMSGVFMMLQWSLGETRDLSLDKFLRKYKIEVGTDGRKAKPKKAKTKTVLKKAKPKAKAKSKPKKPSKNKKK